MSHWVRAWEWVLKHPDCPLLIRSYVQKRAGRIIDKKSKAPKYAIKFPKGKDPQKEKRDLKAECEALCKAIVFQRDCGDWRAREGYCVTCRHLRTLQWGHFIPRKIAPYLLYSAAATAGQCAYCNGPAGQGMSLQFASAIDERDGVGAAELLRQMSEANKPWSWNKARLTQVHRELIETCRQKGINPDEVLSEPRAARSQAAP